MKILLIIIDGLGDEPHPQFDHKTPLELAHTPHLDFLAQKGICGLVLPWRKRKNLPTSEDTHLAIFGYSPTKSNPGRGVLEALGLGLKIKKEDICFRGNFATVDENLKIIDRRAGRIEETEKLISALNQIRIKGVKMKIYKSFGHRFVLVLKGKKLSEKVGSNDPKKVGEKVLKFTAQKREAKKTAVILNEFLERARAILERHPLNEKRIKSGFLPANYLLLRGPGKLKKVENFQEKYKMKAGFIAGGTLYKGIGRYLGMKEIKVRGATGKKDTNLKGKILKAIKNLPLYDFIFLHIKAADTFGEDGNFLGKKEFLEKIDKALLPLLKLKNVLVVITGDHPTSCLKKSHLFSFNPLLIFGKGGNGGKQFSERECKKRKWGVVPQKFLLKKIFQLTNKEEKNKMDKL